MSHYRGLQFVEGIDVYTPMVDRKDVGVLRLNSLSEGQNSRILGRGRPGHRGCVLQGQGSPDAPVFRPAPLSILSYDRLSYERVTQLQLIKGKWGILSVRENDFLV